MCKFSWINFNFSPLKCPAMSLLGGFFSHSFTSSLSLLNLCKRNKFHIFNIYSFKNIIFPTLPLPSLPCF